MNLAYKGDCSPILHVGSMAPFKLKGIRFTLSTFNFFNPCGPCGQWHDVKDRSNRHVTIILDQIGPVRDTIIATVAATGMEKTKEIL